MSFVVTTLVIASIGLLVYYILRTVNKNKHQIEAALHQPNLSMAFMRSSDASIGKVRQQYQAIRKWYIEQNKKLHVLLNSPNENPVSSTPYFLQSVSDLQMSSISQMTRNRTTCCSSMSADETTVWHLMDFHSLIDFTKEDIRSLFGPIERIYVEKDTTIIEKGQQDQIILLLSGQIKVSEDGYDDIVWEELPYTTYQSLWELILLLLNPEHKASITVQAMTPCVLYIFHVKKSMNARDQRVIASLVQKEISRMQRLLQCPVLQEISNCMQMKSDNEDEMKIEELYPSLYNCIMNENNAMKMRKQVTKMIKGEGDELLCLHKGQSIAVLPYTIIVLLDGTVVWPKGEISMLFSKGSILPNHSSSSFYVTSAHASLLFIPYNGELTKMSNSCLEFILYYCKERMNRRLHCMTRDIRWIEKERNDCVITEKDDVENAMIIVSGRVRSTKSTKHHEDEHYKLNYRLSYDGRHVFSEKEKEEVACRMKERGHNQEVCCQHDDEAVEYGGNNVLFFDRCLNHDKASINLYCTRKTEILLLPSRLLVQLIQKQPVAMFNYIHDYNTLVLIDHVQNIATIAATQNSSSLKSFSQLLFAAMNAIQHASYITSQDRRRASNLAFQDSSQSTILVGDGLVKGWNQQVLDISDSVLLVVNVCDSPLSTKDYSLLREMMIGIRREIVFLREVEDDVTDSEYEKKLNEWRQVLAPLAPQRVYHVVIRRDAPLLDLANNRSDIRRLARYLTNTAIGVVMSGGGARGYAHVGVLRAMDELLIPVDYLGGTSMGAFVGGIASENRGDYILTRKKVKKGAKKLASTMNQIFDITLPILSLTKGNLINSVTKGAFSKRLIENSLIPYFCICSDITNCKELVAQNGAMWRYVRGSMSILNIFPPIGDESVPRPNMLVDGGYCNNVPSDVMCTLFNPNTVITVNVEGYPDEENAPIYDTQSGFSLYIKQLFPVIFGQQINKSSIQQKLMYTWSENRRIDNLLKKSDVVIRPPLRDVYLADNNRYDEIEERGYNEGKQRLMEWIRLIPKQSALYNALFVTPKYPFKQSGATLARSSSYH